MVEIMLSTEERCRNDDKYLIHQIYRKILNQDDDSGLYITLADLPNLPSTETIIRIRAKIQNVHRRHLPTDAVILRRRHRRVLFCLEAKLDTMREYAEEEMRWKTNPTNLERKNNGD